MTVSKRNPLWEILSIYFKPHPWHGVSIGDDAPDLLTCYIEIVPTDTVKYEIEKTTGYLQVDRPQKFSNLCPTLYGLVPQTYCGESVAALSAEKLGRSSLIGDGDPLDICVLSEKTITHGDILLQAIPIGGLRMIDGDEADDKIIAVLKGDVLYGEWKDISDCPKTLINRIVHYFTTYKQAPGAREIASEVTHVYGRLEAHEVIRRSRQDYLSRFQNLTGLLDTALDGSEIAAVQERAHAPGGVDFQATSGITAGKRSDEHTGRG